MSYIINFAEISFVLVLVLLAPYSASATPVYGYKVINIYPHDADAWTQGLIFENGYLYEGTGLYGSSSLRKVDLQSGNILKIFLIDYQYFGEGITLYESEFRQVTWRNNKGFVYVEKDTFELVSEFSYPTEGWGLTHDSTYLIMSDGSNILHFLDPVIHQQVYQIEVLENGSPITRLNELEYIQGLIYANVWRTDSIVIINPGSGDVVGWLNLKGLLSNYYPSRAPDVLNGIAFDREDVRLFVTGKRWPKLFEIEVDPINYPPQIISYEPSSPCSIMVDSILKLTVIAVDPDSSDRLVYTWSINGIVDTSGHDSVYYYSSNVVTVDTVKVTVSDQMYADSVSWIINVYSIGILEGRSPVPFEIALEFSNPFGSNSIIMYRVPIKEHVSLKLYDINGRLIRVFVDETKNIGSYQIPFCDHNLKSGIYFVKLTIGNLTRVKKMTLVR